MNTKARLFATWLDRLSSWAAAAFDAPLYLLLFIACVTLGVAIVLFA